MTKILPSPRIKASPFYDATIAEGAQGFTTYNNVLLPTTYGDPEGEYWRLLNGVSMWDVACERQVQLKGRHATALAQILTTRNLDSLSVGRGKYAPICNHSGVLLNDPVFNRLDDDLYWISLADSQIYLWASAIAAERALEVEVSESYASPLAIQGPEAENVVAAIFGESIRTLRFFHFREVELEGIPLLVQRSGYSKQGGFEIYLCDHTQGSRLWNIVRDAGEPWGIKPGTPNHSERIEAGFLSFGTDTDWTTNPYELRLGKYVDLNLPDEVIGISALRKIKDHGIKRHQLGVIIEAELSHGLARSWYDVLLGEEKVGSVTSTCHSWRLGRSIGLAIVSTSVLPGDTVEVDFEGSVYEARVTNLPFF